MKKPDTLSKAHSLLDRSCPAKAKKLLLRFYKQPAKSRARAISKNSSASHTSPIKIDGLLLSALGKAEAHLGNTEKAIEHNDKALMIGSETKNPLLTAQALLNLGVVYLELDQYSKALGFLRRSLSVANRRAGSGIKKNRILFYLALLYCKTSDSSTFRQYIKKALNAAHDEKDLIGTGRCLNAQGFMLLDEGRYESSKIHFQKAIKKCKKSGDRHTEGVALSNLGFVNLKLKRFAEAKALLEKAQEIFSSAGNLRNEVSVLLNQAHLHLERGEWDSAKTCSKKALMLAKKTAGIRDDADAYYLLGTIKDDYLNESHKAYACYKEAINLFERIRKDIGIDDLKISFAEDISACYEQMVSLCVKLGRNDEAFEYAERSKARALIDMLGAQSENIPPHLMNNKWLKELMSLRERLRLLRKRASLQHQNIDFNAGGKTGRSEGDEDSLFKDIHSLEDKYNRAYEKLEIADREWLSLFNVESFKPGEIQGLLDEETMLVEYYQCRDRLFIFVISAGGECQVRQVDMDMASGRRMLNGLLKELHSGKICDIRSHEFHKDIRLPLSSLYSALLRPIEDLLHGAKRLLIVPHIFWHHLPFHALFDDKRRKYLIDEFELSCSPSAEVFEFCFKKTATRRKSALILANPTRNLPYAEDEAKKIARYFGGNAMVFKRGNATVERFIDSPKTDIIHLSSHCHFNGKKPMLSHFFLAGSEKPKPIFLRDIFNFNLKASLVTVSACESGLGCVTSGDDLIGFARAFFYAGTPSILASLWKVEDKSTALFMDEFYRNFIMEKRDKSGALRHAVLKIKSIKEYQHMFYWAPFILMGMWK